MDTQPISSDRARLAQSFSTQITPAIDALAIALADPEGEQIFLVLPVTLNAVMRLGQADSITGLSTIVTLIQTALLNDPEKVIEIGRIALQQFQQVQAIILSGSSLEEIHPSEQLIAIAEPPADLLELTQQLADLDMHLGYAEPTGMSVEVMVSQTSASLPKFVTDSLVQELQAVLDDDSGALLRPLREPETLSPLPDADPMQAVQEELSDSFVSHLRSLIDEPSDLKAKAAAVRSRLGQSPSTEPAIGGSSNANKNANDKAIKVRPLEVSSSLRQMMQGGGNNRTPLTGGTNLDTAQTIKSRLTDYYLASTVRVDLKRLTQLHNLVGELVTQENLAQLHNQQYYGIVDSIEKRFTQFDAITKELQYWLDQSQNYRAQLSVQSKSSRFSGSGHGSDQLPPAPGVLPLKQSSQEFDPLLMDQYNHLYVLAQSLMEELAQMEEAVQDVRLLTRESKYTQQKRQYTLKQVRDQLLRARMLPVADILQRFPRMVRDLSMQYNKPVKVKLNGTQTLLDKAILEKLFDPLVHLVRNCFDHGIESHTGRVAQGKPLEGTIEIRAYARGNQTYIEVRDDGRGLDCDAILRKIVDRKLLSLEAAVELSPQQLYEYIFNPGFSTTSEVTELSGRGVGMDAVRTQVRQLKGSISLQSEPGKGTTFTLRFPLTLTTAMLVVFQIHNQLMAVPVDTLIAVASASLDQIDLVDGQQVLLWQGKKIPLYPSEALLGSYPLTKKMPIYGQYLPLSQAHEMPVLILAGETELLALPVDRLLQEQELVIKPFGAIAAPPAYFYGCTVLGDGSLVPVLDGEALIARSKTMDYNQLLHPGSLQLDNNLSDSFGDNLSFDALGDMGSMTNNSAIVAQKTILVVDDSLTARHFLSMTLEKSGYQVVQAKDGRDALNCLSLNSAIDAIFCDVEMPRMNGFEFLENANKSLGSGAPPIIMLTSRSSEKHVQTAQALGAKAYLTKPYLEQELLETLDRCWNGGN
jgi:two-component system, chemotaxis family, sensor histidine kinase and response regulator PixL